MQKERRDRDIGGRRRSGRLPLSAVRHPTVPTVFLARLVTSVVFFGFISLAYAYSGGPDPGYTNAPGEGNCTECHDSFGEETNTGPGFISVTHPSRYEDGQRMRITVEVGQTGARRWGFQLTALTSDTNEPAGQFIITDPGHTQLIQGLNGRWYVEHTGEGTFAGNGGGANWTFDWIAPESDIGPVVFYVSGNAANNSGDRLGDRIYTTLSTISPPSYPAATILEPGSYGVVSPGELVSIEWEATDNADAFDILFFPFPGGLPETVAFGLPADTRQYEWTVPNLLSDSARIAVLAFNDAGFGVHESPLLIVNQNPALLSVTEPSQPQMLKGGDVLRIAWTVGPNLKVARQQVRLSVDGGRTFPQMLTPARFSTDARSFNWSVPTDLRTMAARALIIVQTEDNLLADESDVDVVIDNPE